MNATYVQNDIHTFPQPLASLIAVHIYVPWLVEHWLKQSHEQPTTNNFNPKET